MKGYGSTGNGILDGGLVDEGDGVGILLIFIYIGDPSGSGMVLTPLHVLHEESDILIALRPGNLLALVLHATDATAHDVVVGAVDHRLRVVHQFEFLHALLLHRAEILLMGRAQTGEYADGGLDDVTQGRHLSWLADAGLEDADLRLLVQQPYREGYANLGVITAGRTHNLL